MKKLIFLFLIINSSLFAQHTNVFRDSTVFTKALTLTPGASSGKALISDATGNATWQSISGLDTNAVPISQFWNTKGNSGTNPATDFIGTTDSKDLVFKTKNAEAMRIDTNGNVGIGTTSAPLPLSVQGNVLFADNVNSPTVVFSFNATENTMGALCDSADFIIARTKFIGSLQITDGTQSNGYVLTSDANGLASWQGRTDTIFVPATGDTIRVKINSMNIIESAGTLSSMVIYLPSSPIDGDFLEFKNGAYTLGTITYANGTVGASAFLAYAVRSFQKLVYSTIDNKWH